MLNIKRISLIAVVLLIVGITGSVFTFTSAYQSEEILKQEVIQSEEIAHINIRTDNGKTTILPTDETQIRMELSTKNNKYELLTEVDGNTLFIEAIDQQKKFVNFDIFSFGATLTVYIPEKAYDSLHVESDNGLITVNQMQANDIDVKTDNGKIELKDINSSSVKVNTSNGKVVLDHVQGDLVGKTNNGIIELVTEDLERSIDLETDNGKIGVQTMQEPINVTFDVRVGNGKIKVFGDSNWDTVIGNGEHLIKLKTDNGSITVTK